MRKNVKGSIAREYSQQISSKERRGLKLLEEVMRIDLKDGPEAKQICIRARKNYLRVYVQISSQPLMAGKVLSSRPPVIRGEATLQFLPPGQILEPQNRHTLS